MKNIPVIAPKRNTLTIKAKLEMLKEWASLGISTRQLADLKGNINYSQLYKWKWNLAGIPQMTNCTIIQAQLLGASNLREAGRIRSNRARAV